MPPSVEVLGVRLDYIFVANPRTGSISIDTLLNYRHIFNHTPARSIRSRLGPVYDEMYSFGLVRHPLDRLVSWFHFHKQLKFDYRHKDVYPATFREWVLRGCPHHWQETPWVQEGWLQSPLNQWEFFMDGTEIIVDYVGRFEQMETSMQTICARIGADPTKLKASNASQRGKDYRKYFDEETQAIAVNLLRRDFEVFGYEP